VDLRSPDFAELGEAYGAHGVKLSSASQLRDAVQAAVAQPGVTVIECPLDGPLLQVPPPWL